MSSYTRSLLRANNSIHYSKFVVSMDDVWQDNIEGVRHRHIADFLTDGNW